MGGPNAKDAGSMNPSPLGPLRLGSVASAPFVAVLGRPAWRPLAAVCQRVNRVGWSGKEEMVATQRTDEVAPSKRRSSELFAPIRGRLDPLQCGAIAGPTIQKWGR